MHSAEEAVAAAGGARCLVIGGESVYRQLLPYTNRVYVTRIELAPHSTAFFPDLDAAPEWVCTDPGVPLSEDGVAYRFCIYERVLDKES